MQGNIQSVLRDLLSHTPSREGLKKYVAITHRLALAYLRTKVHQRRLSPRFLGVSLDDAALDAIAPLFERSTNASFPVLREYYGNGDCAQCSEESLHSLTRRLVFSRVNEFLFTTYRELDPTLSRIIRNLKRAIPEVEGLSLSRTSGTQWLLHKSADAASHLPLIPPEILSAYLISTVAKSNSSVEVVHAVDRYFTSNRVYRRAYPVTLLAYVVRDCYTELYEPEEVVSPVINERFVTAEIIDIIDDSVAEMRHRMRETYVRSSKLSSQEYTLYFQAVHERLDAEYVLLDGHGFTNFKALCNQMPELTRSDYRRNHRAVFEYLFKLTREQVVATLARVYPPSGVS